MTTTPIFQHLLLSITLCLLIWAPSLSRAAFDDIEDLLGISGEERHRSSLVSISVSSGSGRSRSREHRRGSHEATQRYRDPFGGIDEMEMGETRAFLEFLKNISYDHRQRPESVPGQPTVVSVSILVGSIRKVSEVTMDYHLELFFREKWHDGRLGYEDHMKKAFANKSQIVLHESYAAFLWHPDTFMPNAIESENPKEDSITHRSLLRLFREGGVLYSRRISITAECPMDLTLFPFDRQVCRLEIESYGYPESEVKYQWDDRPDPVQWTAEKIKLPDFELKKISVNYTIGYYSTGNYSRLIACFYLSRSSGFCFLQLIIPSTAVVVASWVSLWMENETTFQTTKKSATYDHIEVTTLSSAVMFLRTITSVLRAFWVFPGAKDIISIILTLTFLIYSYNTVMPRVSYIKAMDVYLGACFAFVFVSLIKLAIVKYLRQRLQIAPTESVAVCSQSMQLNSLVKQNLNVSSAVPRSSSSVGEGGTVTGNGLQAVTYIAPDVAGSEADVAMTVDGDVTGVNNMTSSDVNHHHTMEYSLVHNKYVNLRCDMWSCMRRFHLCSQIVIPLAFVTFVTAFFIAYPSASPESQVC